MSSILFWGAIWITFLAAALCLRKQLHSKGNERLTNVCLAVLVSLSLFLLLETGFRVRHMVVRDIPFFSSLSNYQHRELGWLGRKSFGDPETTNRKILVVGDSFTHGMGVPRERMYYSLLGKKLDAEIFAYGGAGYGTLQELLLVRKYLAQVKPDLILLQVCSNDLINNSWELDSKSYHNNTPLPRPYWEHGRINYRFPRSMPGLRVFLPSHSRLFHFLFTKLELLQLMAAKAGYLHSIEEDIVQQGTRLPEFARAVSVTEELLSQFKETASSAQVIAFSSESVPPYTAEISAILEKQGILFIPQAAEEIVKEEQAGKSLKLADGVHWNEAGHEVVARVLFEELLKTPESADLQARPN